MKKYLFLLVSVLSALAPLSAGNLYPADTSRVRFTVNYHITSTPGTRWCRFIALVPKSQDRRQEVLSVDYSVPPTKIFESDGSTYAEYDFNGAPGDTTLRITVDAVLHRYDLAHARMLPAALTQDDLSPYLREEQHLEVRDPEITAAAKKIASADDLATVRKAYDYATSRLSYRGYVQEDLGTAAVLKKGYGDCSDFSDVLVALLRASGIPARPVDGYLMDYGSDVPRHTWVEAWTREYGWVTVDPLLGSLKKVTFDGLEPNYLYLSHLRNDPVLSNFHFYWGSYLGGSVVINESYSVEKIKQVALTNG